LSIENYVFPSLSLPLFVQAFHRDALQLGRRIIDEFALNIEQKSIKPIKIGGFAGGTKLVANGIFFKVFISFFTLNFYLIIFYVSSVCC
jgi:hypothetical protein